LGADSVNETSKMHAIINCDIRIAIDLRFRRLRFRPIRHSLKIQHSNKRMVDTLQNALTKIHAFLRFN
jgi:hypothetical protein